MLRAHLPQQPLHLLLVDAHVRRTRREAQAPDVARLRAPVDRLDDSAFPVHAELERERVPPAPIGEAVEAWEPPVAGEGRRVERADERLDVAHPPLLPCLLVAVLEPR